MKNLFVFLLSIITTAAFATTGSGQEGLQQNNSSPFGQRLIDLESRIVAMGARPTLHGPISRNPQTAFERKFNEDRFSKNYVNDLCSLTINVLNVAQGTRNLSLGHRRQHLLPILTKLHLQILIVRNAILDAHLHEENVQLSQQNLDSTESFVSRLASEIGEDNG